MGESTCCTERPGVPHWPCRWEASLRRENRLGGMGRSRTRGESGYSLIEALVSIVLISTILVGVITGILVTVDATRRNQSGSKATAAFSAVSERLRVMPYRPCATAAQLASDYQAAPYSPTFVGGSPLVEVLAVRRWNPSTSSFDAAGSVCTRDSGVVVAQIRVSIAGSMRTGDVTLRNPTAMPT